MKINEQLMPSGYQKPADTQTSTYDFERFLCTPTQHENGDEYYWHHQEQLQPSCLQFKACNYAPKKPLELKAEQQHDTARVIEEKNPLSAEPAYKTDSDKASVAEYFVNTTAIEQIITQVKQTISQVSIALGNQSKRDQSNVEKTQSLSQSIGYKPSFKNHHVFLHDNEIELTLNTQELKPDEQKELKHLIKVHLKKQGLILKQFIINGVPHD